MANFTLDQVITIPSGGVLVPTGRTMDTVYQEKVLASTPDAFFTFQGTGNDVALDASQNDRDGTVSAGTFTPETHTLDSGEEIKLIRASNSPLITVPDDAVFKGTDLTMEFICINDDDTNNVLFERGNTNTNWSIQTGDSGFGTPGGLGIFQFGVGTATTTVDSRVGGISNSKPTHVVMTNAGGRFKAWVNGLKVVDNSSGYDSVQTDQGAVPIHLFSRNGSFGSTVAVGYFSIYSRELSQTEIDLHYKAFSEQEKTLGEGTVAQEWIIPDDYKAQTVALNPLGYWPLDSDYSNIVPNGDDMVVVGNPIKGQPLNHSKSSGNKQLETGVVYLPSVPAGTVSIEAWIKITGTHAGWHGLLSVGGNLSTDTGRTLLAFVTPGTNDDLNVYSDSFSYETADGDAAVNFDSFKAQAKHIVWQVEGSDTVVYVDGVKRTSLTVNRDVMATAIGKIFAPGCYTHTSGANGFLGAADGQFVSNIAMYDRVLTQAEIDSRAKWQLDQPEPTVTILPTVNNYTESKEQFDKNIILNSNPMSYWPLNGDFADEVSGSTTLEVGDTLAQIDYENYWSGKKAADVKDAGGILYFDQPATMQAVEFFGGFFTPVTGYPTLIGINMPTSGFADRMMFLQDTAGESKMKLYFDGNHSGFSQYAASDFDNKPRHILLQREGTTTKLYVDGIVECTHSENPFTRGSGDRYVQFGYHGGIEKATDLGHGGMISNIAIYDRALTTSEIAARVKFSKQQQQPVENIIESAIPKPLRLWAGDIIATNATTLEDGRTLLPCDGAYSADGTWPDLDPLIGGGVPPEVNAVGFNWFKTGDLTPITEQPRHYRANGRLGGAKTGNVNSLIPEVGDVVIAEFNIVVCSSGYTFIGVCNDQGAYMAGNSSTLKTINTDGTITGSSGSGTAFGSGDVVAVLLEKRLSDVLIEWYANGSLIRSSTWSSSNNAYIGFDNNDSGSALEATLRINESINGYTYGGKMPQYTNVPSYGLPYKIVAQDPTD